MLKRACVCVDMNIDFELQCIKENQLFEENLAAFRDFTIGVDAELLLRKVQNSNAL